MSSRSGSRKSSPSSPAGPSTSRGAATAHGSSVPKEISSRGSPGPQKRLPAGSAGIAVHFGPGNIGRGLIAPMLQAAGFKLVFCHHKSDTQKGGGNSYTIKEYAPHKNEPVNEVVIKDYDWYSYEATYNEVIVDKIANASIVTCATGAKGEDYKRIGGYIAQGLKRRQLLEPLAVIACENAEKATKLLKDKMNKAPIEKVAFANCVIDRVVPKPREDRVLVVEKHKEWIVEDVSGLGSTRQALLAGGVELVPDIDFWFRRKKYTLNTGHAVAGYYGHFLKYKYIHEAIMDKEVRKTVFQALDETRQYLYPSSQIFTDVNSSHKMYIEKVVDRFGNAALMDDISRVCAGPIRKLGLGERLCVPAAGLAKRVDKKVALPTECPGLITGMKMALRYNLATDEESRKLSRTMSATRPDQLLEDLLAVEKSHTLYNDMLKAVEEVQHEFYESNRAQMYRAAYPPKADSGGNNPIPDQKKDEAPKLERKSSIARLGLKKKSPENLARQGSHADKQEASGSGLQSPRRGAETSGALYRQGSNVRGPDTPSPHQRSGSNGPQTPSSRRGSHMNRPTPSSRQGAGAALSEISSHRVGRQESGDGPQAPPRSHGQATNSPREDKTCCTPCLPMAKMRSRRR